MAARARIPKDLQLRLAPDRPERPRPRDRAAVLAALEANATRRRRAERELEVGRLELAELVIEGRFLLFPLQVTAMARAAGISRNTAHELLRRALADDDGEQAA